MCLVEYVFSWGEVKKETLNNSCELKALKRNAKKKMLF